MFEHKSEPLVPFRRFVRRQLRFALFATGVLSFSLLIGVFGYHLLGNLHWVDALLNASMILGGMGPVDTLSSNASKVFASFYALYSGVVFISTIAVFLAPGLHRLMHVLHLETKKN